MKTENIYYQHYKTGNVYRVVSRDVLLENPDTKEWVPGVLYEEWIHINPENGTKIYVRDQRKFMRSETRFKESFKPWEDGE